MTTSRHLSEDLPQRLLKEFREASSILASSPKASAALSRHCLQTLLDARGGVTEPGLTEQIDRIAGEEGLPPHLSEELKRVRDVCDFARYPVKSTNPGQIVDVEPGEAEKLLEILEGILDFYFPGLAKATRPRIAFTEEELINPENLQGMSILSNGIAHDFNNLLTAILGNVALAKLSMAYEDVVIEKLDRAEEVAGHARELVKQLLLFARGGDPVFEELLIPKVIEDAAHLVLSNSGVRWQLFIPDNPWPISADRGQMGRVLRSLLTNAREAMPQGGTITISVRNVPARETEALPLERKNYVKISIEDRGGGIPKDRIPHVFDPYFTTKEVGSRRGTGLGLSISFAMIRRHGGYVGVVSEEGVGTAFHIYMPATVQGSETGSPRERECPRKKARVLLVEGEDQQAQVVMDKLKILGYEAESAGSGAEGVECYRNAKTRGEPFASVIIDLNILRGLGGAETMNELLAIDPGVRAVLSSGYSTDSRLEDFAGQGFSGFVAKPYRTSELKDILGMIISDASRPR